MKILHIISSVNPAGGGPIEGVQQLGAVNQSYGHRVEVASLDAPDAPYLKSFHLPVHPLGPSWLKYRYSNRFVPWLKEHAHRYDVVIVNGIWQYHSYAAWRALEHSDTPYVVYTHGMLDPWFKKRYPLKHVKKMLYWPWAERRVLRDASAVLFTCEEERRLARQSFRSYECNEIVVNYGTAGPLGEPKTELGTFWNAHPELRGKRLAIYLGRIHQKKGCDLLIEGFAKVLAKDQDWHLLMCGPDQVGWRAALQENAKHFGVSERITWIDMVKDDMKWGALRASEIFVLPSHQENFGIVVAEALACEVPVLISDKVNIWNEVKADAAGIVGTDDLNGTCTMLERWIGMTDDERARMQSRTRECFLKRFEIHAAAQSLIATLSHFVSEKAAPCKASVETTENAGS